MRRRAALALLLAAICTATVAWSQPAANTVRYHYGDNPAWADPSFDDASWPAAINGSWPAPPLDSDGFVWIRLRVPVPAALSGGQAAPLALREVAFQSAPQAEAIYLNGLLIGSNGVLPPHPQPWTAPLRLVFALPGGSLPATHDAFIAVRAWIRPADRAHHTYATQFAIGDAATQSALAREARYSLLFHELPTLLTGLLLVLLGFGLAALGAVTRRRELLLFALVLITGPLQAALYVVTGSHLLPLPARLLEPVMFLLLAAVPISYIQFLWEALQLGGRGWKVTAQIASFLAAAADLWIGLSNHPQALHFLLPALIATGLIRDVLESGAAVWAMATRRSGRLLAFAILLTPATSLLDFGSFLGPQWETFSGALFENAVMVGGLFIAGILLWRAWTAWRTGERLKGELDAARAVQQRLVPVALPPVPGCSIAAAYLPATEVGGDFYQVLPQPAGTTLIVVGDVSGKGLKAAMTGALVLGGLRSLAQEIHSPAQILTRLNDQLAAASDGGFVTCLCARIDADGAFTLANAGHLAPYRNGQEVPLESSLPLGIAPGVAYAESTIQLAPNDQLTFLSDGVVEAQSPTGELFGFDRTCAVSMQSAQQIAAAAQAHGQEDDITVLTLTFTPAEVLHA
jgi:Stage II sporulation protein E (SpoIIE)